VIAALLSILLLMTILFFVEQEFYLLFTLQDIEMILYLFGGITILGVLINYVSTYFSVSKYLGINEDKLYF
jgi:cell division transport system permease protein